MNMYQRLFAIRWSLVIITMLAISMTNCQQVPATNPPVVPTVIAPTIVESTKPSKPEAPLTNPAGPELTVEAGQKLSITAESAGADRYEWSLQGDGILSANVGPAVLYTAPETDTIAIITVTAYNDQGASPSTAINVKVSGLAALQLDAVGIPAGWMSGGGNPATYIEVKGGEPGECHTSVSCLKFTYKLGGSWNGILWWPLICGDSGTPAAWEKVEAGTCGVNVLDTGNLRTITRLSFWARGNQGGEVIEFKIGDVAIPPSPGRGLGKITLGSEWKQYSVDLEGMDLTNAIALFTWVASDVDNPQGAVFYLSEVQFEGVK